jgi:hypothetical protein
MVLDVSISLLNILLVVEGRLFTALVEAPNPPKMFFVDIPAKIEEGEPIMDFSPAVPLKGLLGVVVDASLKGDAQGLPENCCAGIPPKIPLLGAVMLSFGIGGGLAIAVKWCVVWKKGGETVVGCVTGRVCAFEDWSVREQTRHHMGLYFTACYLGRNTVELIALFYLGPNRTQTKV